MKCTKCGNEIPEGFKFCGICGENVAVPEEVQTQPQKKGVSAWVVLLIIFASLFIIAAGIPMAQGYMAAARENSSSKPYTTDKIQASTTSKQPTYTTTSTEDYMSGCLSIEYETLARNPDKYKGNNLKYYGKIIQTVYPDTGTEVTLRVAVNANDFPTDIDDVILVTLNLKPTQERLLEDDLIIIYGECMGSYSYETIFGQKVTLPYIKNKYFERCEKPDPITVDENGNQTFTFDGLEITIGTELSFGVYENKYSEYNGEAYFAIPVSVKNISAETSRLSAVYIDCFDLTGVETRIFLTSYDSDIFNDLRPGASVSGHIDMRYDGDGDYYIEFFNYSEKIEVKIPVEKQ